MSDRNREKAAVAGSSVATLAVLLSSACCVGPLGMVFAWVGLSGSTLLAVENVMGPFRPWVLAGTAVALGMAFRLTYAGGRDACDVDGSTDGSSSSVGRGMHVVVLWGSTAFFVLLLYFSYVHPNLDRLIGVYM